MTDRTQKFLIALDAVDRLLDIYPQSRPLRSAKDQLEYLVGVSRGETPFDRDRLDRINIGVIAAKEIEDMDEAAADSVHCAAAEARAMA